MPGHNSYAHVIPCSCVKSSRPLAVVQPNTGHSSLYQEQLHISMVALGCWNSMCGQYYSVSFMFANTVCQLVPHAVEHVFSCSVQQCALHVDQLFQHMVQCHTIDVHPARRHATPLCNKQNHIEGRRKVCLTVFTIASVAQRFSLQPCPLYTSSLPFDEFGFIQHAANVQHKKSDT